MRTCLDTGENIDNFSEQKVGKEDGKDDVSSPESQVIRREQQLNLCAEKLQFQRNVKRLLQNFHYPSKGRWK